MLRPKPVIRLRLPSRPTSGINAMLDIAPEGGRRIC